MSKENLKNRGITLIALIITIIVMLILTGVTLSITLGDNGLVNKAKEAAEETQVAMDRELLLSAVVGAMGNDGKVNLSAIVLPEGFTGSNGTYTSKSGNTFTVSENGEIVYIGNSNSGVENIVLDLSGKYYYYTMEYIDFYYEIVDNKLFRAVYYDESTDTEEIEGEAPIVSIDEENKTFEVRIYEDMNNLDVYESIICSYVLIEENDKFVNKLLIFADELYIQNTNGFEYNLEGIYLDEEGNSRLVFDSENGRCDLQYKNRDEEYGSSSYDESMAYFSYDNIYYMGGAVITVSEDLNTVIYNDKTYIKEVETEGTLISMYRAGEKCTENNCTNEEHLHVGDYVNYSPDTTVTEYYPDGQAIGSKTGSTNELQVIEQEEMKWRVLGASNNNVLLISSEPTTKEISFYGYIGYNNYEDILNTACTTLYSKTGIGTARSMTINDIKKHLGSTYDEKTYSPDNVGGSTGGNYGYYGGAIQSVFDYNRTINILEKLEQGSTTNLSLSSNAYSYVASNYIENPINLEILEGTNNKDYYIASRSIKVGNDYAGRQYAHWCVNLVVDGEVVANWDICASPGYEYSRSHCMRPVVSLESNVTIDEVSKK